MKFILPCILLMSCAHQENVRSVDEETSKAISDFMAQTKEDIRRIDYFIEHDRCFTTYNMCMVQKKKSPELCWDNHEKCVVDTYRKWKNLPK